MTNSLIEALMTVFCPESVALPAYSFVGNQQIEAGISRPRKRRMTPNYPMRGNR